MDAQLEAARIRLGAQVAAARQRAADAQSLYRWIEELGRELNETTERLDSIAGSSAEYRVLTVELERQTAEYEAHVNKLDDLNAQCELDYQGVAHLIADVSLLEDSIRRQEQSLIEGPVKTPVHDRPTVLAEFLHIRHELECGVTIVTDPKHASDGHVEDPVGKLCPWKIVPTWRSGYSHRKVWQRVPPKSAFLSEALFPSRRELEVRQAAVQKINSEDPLRYFHECAIAKGVEQLFEVASRLPEVKSALQLDWRFTSCDSRTLGIKNWQLVDVPDRYYLAVEPSGVKRAIVALIGKPPHKLPLHSILRGLNGPIDVWTDVLNLPQPTGDADACDEWSCRRLVTAVMVEMFEGMIASRVSHGCVYTGEAYIFVRMGSVFGVLEAEVYVPGRNRVTSLDAVFDTSVAILFGLAVEAAIDRTIRDWATHDLRRWHEHSISDLFSHISIGRP